MAEGQIVLALKSVEILQGVHEMQWLTYLTARKKSMAS
ncbi:MAG: GxxExxY protein [Gammaproteobacteria bacterium]|nr:GxxExxY protein [Gammaproteobacteria bacterium]